MPDTLDDLFPKMRPSAERPLAGAVMLVVEDSRLASEAIRLMCVRAGARVRRADSLASAARHLGTYRPTVAIIDPGLPDGDGTDLIAELSSAPQPILGIVAVSGDPEREAACREAGAGTFLTKPVTSVPAFLEAVLNLLPPELRPDGEPVFQDKTARTDALALQDDLALVQDALTNADVPGKLAYAAQFLSSVGRAAGDAALEEASRLLSAAEDAGSDRIATLAQVSSLIATRVAPRGVV